MWECFFARELRRIDALMDISNSRYGGRDPSHFPNLAEMYESVLGIRAERMATEVVLPLLVRVMIGKWRHLVMLEGYCLFPDHERGACDVSVEVETNSM